MVNCFCGMFNRCKACSLISSWDHSQRSLPSWISNTARACIWACVELCSSMLRYWPRLPNITSECYAPLCNSQILLYKFGDLGLVWDYYGISIQPIILHIKTINHWYCKPVITLMYANPLFFWRNHVNLMLIWLFRVKLCKTNWKWVYVVICNG